MLYRVFLLVAVGMSVIFAGLRADAQSLVPITATTSTAVTLPDPLTKEAIDALVSRLDDTQVRQLLLDQLDAKAASPVVSEGQSINDFFYHVTFGALGSITSVITDLPKTVTGQIEAFRTFTAIHGSDAWWSVLYAMAAGLVAGLTVELLFRRMVLSWFRPPAVIDTPTRGQSIGFLPNG